MLPRVFKCKQINHVRGVTFTCRTSSDIIRDHWLGDARVVNFANEEARAELEVVLASAAFVRSQRMASLLRYLCTKYFTGQSDQVKEYNIAVEVFGRPETFDPSDD